MSLSDSCCEINSGLAEAFVRYADWGYSVDHLTSVIDAMFEISKVASSLDVPPFVQDNERKQAIDQMVMRLVISELLDKNRSNVDDKEAVRDKLAEIASQHPRLLQSIIHVYNWRNSSKQKASVDQSDDACFDIDELYRLCVTYIAA